MTAQGRQVVLAALFWCVFGPLALLGVLCLPIGIAIYACGNEHIRAWVYRCGKALDQFDNALIFGGLPQETISSHCGRWQLSGLPMPLKVRFVIWLTNFFEQDHCLKAVEPPFVGMEL